MDFFGVISILVTLDGGATRNRTGDRGVADLCLTAWPWHRFFDSLFCKKDGHDELVPISGADYGARTRHLHLGKVALYQMS